MENLREELKIKMLEKQAEWLQCDLDRLMIAYAELEFKYKNVKAELMYYKKGDEAD